MIPAKFDYVRPASLEEAVTALGSTEDAKVMAGGQSLLPILRLRLSYPELVVDLGGNPDLVGVRDDGDAIVVGAMTTHADVLRDPLVQQHAPLLVQTTATVADRQVRHRGTFGGALAHADAAGDLGTAALAMGAEMVVHGPSGRRTVPASEFFVDYLTTVLEPDELLVEVRLPKHPGEWGVHYEKFHRVAQAWAIVGVAAMVRRENGAIAEARVALTNMGAVPLRASATEAALAGVDATPVGVASAAALADEGTDPPSDLGAQPDYRRHLAQVLTRRAVLAAAGADPAAGAASAVA